MKARDQKVTTTVTRREKKELDELAQKWGLKSGIILRRLVLFFIQGRISMIDLIHKTVGFNYNSEENSHSVQVTLSEIEKREFLIVVQEWDFPVSTILRRLIRALLSGEISKNEFWKIEK